MSRWLPCKRRDFVRKLRQLGFDGPYIGARHEFVVSGDARLALPSNEEYSVPQLRLLIREVEGIMGRGIALEEWERL